MNQTLQSYARQQLKKGLGLLTADHHMVFKRMYSHKDLSKPIDDVVDSIPVDKLDWAMTQVENSLKKLSADTSGAKP